MDGTIWLACTVISALVAYALGRIDGNRAAWREALEMVKRIERGEE